MRDDRTVFVLKALADPTRLQLVRDLAATPAIIKSCGELSASQCLSQPAMSHHFAKLVAAGVLTEQKSGTHKQYKLNAKLLASCGIDPARL